MPRAKTRVASRNRRKKLLKASKGYYGKRGSCIKSAKETVWRGGVYAYAHRKDNKTTFRSMWIMRINAAARLNGTTYGQLIDSLNKKEISINRKMLADLAMFNPEAFTKIVEQAKA